MKYFFTHSFFKSIILLLVTVSLSVGCGDKKEDGEDKKGDETVEETKLTWPTEYRDNRRTGRSSYNGPDTSKVKWVYEAGVQTKHWAVIGADGNVISGFKGKVVCVNTGNGSLVWKFSTGTDFTSTSCVAENGVIYVSAGSKVYALTPKGKEKWSYNVGSEVDEPTLSPEGVVYAGSVGGRLVALSEDGELMWDFKVSGNIHSPSIDSDGNLYCGGSTLVMYALDNDGKIIWEFKPEGELPVYDNVFPWTNCLAIPSIGDDGTIYSGSQVFPGVTTKGKQIEGYAVPQKGKLYAITPQGEKKWEYVHPEGKLNIMTPSIGRDGTLYAGTSIFRVLALNPDGTLLWEFHTGENIGTCPFVFSPSIGKNGLLYSATSSAKMFCITPNGKENWRFSAGKHMLPGLGGSNNMTPPPIGEDGTLFSNLFEGKIYAFKTEE